MTIVDRLDLYSNYLMLEGIAFYFISYIILTMAFLDMNNNEEFDQASFGSGF